jgi:hypothetical protein
LRFVVLKAVYQFPKKNTVEALWRIIQILPNITRRKTLAALPVKTEKHVAYVEPFHPPGKEVDVFSAHRPYVQDLRLWPPFKIFDKKTQNIACIISWHSLGVRLLPGQFSCGRRGYQ